MLLAAMSVGCAAPLNPKYREDEFRFYLDDLGAAALLTVEGPSPAAHAAAPDGDDRHRRSRRGPVDRSRRPAGIASHAAPRRRPGADDQALVLHTSGTTSRPKIVPLRQRNLAASARNIAAALQLTPADRSLNVMPLFHIHGIMAGLLAPLSAGASVVCTPGSTPSSSTAGSTTLQPDLLHGRADDAPDGAGPGAGGRARPRLRFVRSSSAALPGPVLEGLGGPVRRARRRGLRHDRGVAPDDLQPAAAGSHQAGVGRHRRPASRWPSSTPATSCCRPASAARWRSRVDTSSTATRTTPTPTRRPSRTAGSAPATRACSTTTATCSSPAD